MKNKCTLQKILDLITEEDIIKLRVVRAITVEEADNLRKMYASEDPDSMILARKIIKAKFKIHNDGKSK